jgi:hypothetical protein
MTLLTPLGALVALLALAPLATALLGERRIAAVSSLLGLPRSKHRFGGLRVVAATLALVFMGLAAAQPAVTRTTRPTLRRDVQALFVLDTSRSMAASRTPSSPTRLDRATEAAIALRAGIPEVSSGIATMTDRVLPDLLPVSDVPAFDAVARRTVQIESPPPASSSARATTYGALEDVPAGNYFDRTATRRIVVVLTDGESNPFDTSQLALSFGPDRPYRLIAVRFSASNESVYDSDGSPEQAYRPDPAGAAVLNGLASSLGGRAFASQDLKAATRYLQSLTRVGPATSGMAASRRTLNLAPFIAAVALLLVLAAVLSVRHPSRRVRSQLS